MHKFIQRSWFKYIGIFAGAVFGAIFAYLEYGEPLLGLIVGSGVGHIIGFLLLRRLPNISD